MSTGPDVRQRVRHALYGVGVVDAWRRGGRVAVVLFESEALPMEIAARELVDVAAPSGLAVESIAPAMTGSWERGVAQQTLEAMRLGVVPSANLDAYTVGRDYELDLVDSDLENARTEGGAVRAFLGDYGVGKTHLLELIQQRALEANFLVARVVLDPEETSPAHPKRVYRAVVRSLTYPDQRSAEGLGLLPLLQKVAAEAPQATANGAKGQAPHLYLKAAVGYFNALNSCTDKNLPRGVGTDQLAVWVERSRELLLDWIEGHPTLSNQVIDAQLSKLKGRHPHVYSLMDYRPWSRIYGYLLSGISTVARAVGYSGLVVLLDEAEFYSLLNKDNRLFAQDLFKTWTYAATGPSGDAAALPFEPELVGIGGRGVQRKIPAWFGARPGVYFVCAMTPHGDGLEALKGAIPASQITLLNPLTPSDYLELTSRVCDFYASSRDDWTLQAGLVAPMAKVVRGLIQTGYVTTPRHAMKFIIEFLDVVRYHPSEVGNVVRNLQDEILL